jgi:hypothetical protein
MAPREPQSVNAVPRRRHGIAPERVFQLLPRPIVSIDEQHVGESVMRASA